MRRVKVRGAENAGYFPPKHIGLEPLTGGHTPSNIAWKELLTKIETDDWEVHRIAAAMIVDGFAELLKKSRLEGLTVLQVRKFRLDPFERREFFVSMGVDNGERDGWLDFPVELEGSGRQEAGRRFETAIEDYEEVRGRLLPWAKAVRDRLSARKSLWRNGLKLDRVTGTVTDEVFEPSVVILQFSKGLVLEPVLCRAATLDELIDSLESIAEVHSSRCSRIAELEAADGDLFVDRAAMAVAQRCGFSIDAIMEELGGGYQLDVTCSDARFPFTYVSFYHADGVLSVHAASKSKWWQLYGGTLFIKDGIGIPESVAMFAKGRTLDSVIDFNDITSGLVVDSIRVRDGMVDLVNLDPARVSVSLGFPRSPRCVGQ